MNKFIAILTVCFLGCSATEEMDQRQDFEDNAVERNCCRVGEFRGCNTACVIAEDSHCCACNVKGEYEVESEVCNGCCLKRIS